MKVAVVGAGVTGLAAAYDLSRAGHQVTVFEAAGQLGGLASGFKEPDWDWTVEKFYHHWFASDKAIQQFQKELGIFNKVNYYQPHTVAYYQDNFYRLDTVSAIIRFPGFGLIDTLRFGLVTLYLKYLASWKNLEKVTAVNWLQRYYGTHIYQLLWQPLLEGKFNSYYPEANMAWMWARLNARTPSLGTYEGGFQQFFDDVHRKLEALGINFVLNSPVNMIETRNARVALKVNERNYAFDQCLVTLSPTLFASLTPTLPKSYLHKLLSLKSLGAVVLILSLKKPLSKEGHYWYNLPKNQGFPFLALVEHTNFIDRKYFGGDHIVYCGDYVPTDHEYFKLNDTEILARFIPGIKKINPEFTKDWIKKKWLFKVPYAQPIPTLNHSKNIPDTKTPLPNVYFASMSHVYPWDRGTNFAVKLGRDVARRMIAEYEEQ